MQSWEAVRARWWDAVSELVTLVSQEEYQAQTRQRVVVLEHLEGQLGGRGALHPLLLYAVLRTTSQDIPACPRGLQVKHMS